MKMICKNSIFRMVMLIAIVHRNSALPAFENYGNDLQSISVPSGKDRSRPDFMSTIDQVHEILQADPTLPRLTRGEIEDLFEQVTKEEYEKSLQEGDISRATNMRALMLVLPYNTDNSTEQNLQELYTRPPITKVIQSYSLPKPQKFQTPASVPLGKVDIVEVGNLAATTYKPSFRFKEKKQPNPTTYHPAQPFKMPQLTTAQVVAQVPVTSLPLLPDIDEDLSKGTRYSSSYSAKDTDWSLLEGEFNRRNNVQKFTPMPDLSGILESMGMAVQTQATKKFKLEDYNQAAKPAISSTIKQSNRYPGTIDITDYNQGANQAISSSIKQSNRYPGTIDIADFTRTLPPKSNSAAYLEFKPLNIGEEIRVQPDIEQYLNRFGIVNRKRKQIKPEDSSEGAKDDESTKQSEIKIDLPVITVTESTKPVEQQPIKRIDTNVNDSDSNNLQDQEDLTQLTKLLDNLRELERLNVSLTADMLKTVDLSNFNLSSQIRSKGSDSVIKAVDSAKNSIKRQSSTESTSDPIRFNLDLDLDSSESDSATTTTTTTTTKTTTTTTEKPSSTTEESRNGSLADLEDSFGGPDPVTEDPAPPAKKNGFYFLADWNSFLEVGEAGNDQVVVRFDPKIGDPRRFLKVTVP